jgi:hypothetical protein
LNKLAGENKNRRNTWRALEKCENLHGDRFEYLPQLLYWALWPKVNHIQIKSKFQFGA